MALDEGSRHRLHQRLQEILGTEEASILMDHLPATGYRDLATRADLDALRTALKADIEGLRATTKADMQALEHKLLAEIHRSARNLMIAFTTIIAVLNGITFTALKLGG